MNVTHPCDVYRCTDGSLYLAIALDSHWRKLCEVMGRGDLARAPGFGRNSERIANREAVNQVIVDWCAARSVDDALSPLLAAGLVVAKLNSFGEAAAEPHVLERDMLQTVRLCDGNEAPLTGPAAKFSRTPTRVRWAAPVPGAHNAEVLGELGYDPATLDQLRADGII